MTAESIDTPEALGNLKPARARSRKHNDEEVFSRGHDRNVCCKGSREPRIEDDNIHRCQRACPREGANDNCSWPWVRSECRTSREPCLVYLGEESGRIECPCSPATQHNTNKLRHFFNMKPLSIHSYGGSFRKTL